MRVQKENPHRINGEIPEGEVRLIIEGEGAEIISVSKGLEKAEAMGLDFVEISPKAIPPVCKIIDYKKFLYDQKKKQKELKAKQVKVTIKEIRFGPNTDDHDFQFKLKHAHSFLQEGSKVKAYVFFKGRTIVFKERGEILLLRFAQELEEVGIVEQMPKLEGKRMIMMITPKKDKP
ncbi:MAG: translation initiation factor IF-3 [Luteibaculaceae bacterium]|jgi:translation initiation factor IF-3